MDDDNSIISVSKSTFADFNPSILERVRLFCTSSLMITEKKIQRKERFKKIFKIQNLIYQF